MSTKLFYIKSEDIDGEDLSAVVEATDANDAVNQWHRWLSAFLGTTYDNGEPSPDRRVFELPEKTGLSTYFDWHVPSGVIEHQI